MFALKTRYIISIKYKKEKRVKCDMAVYVVGDFLRETRLRKGYTQEEVSYGICIHLRLCRELKMEHKNRDDLFWRNCLNDWVRRIICLILL